MQTMTAEMEILWRLAGRSSLARHAAALESEFQDFRPRILAMMKELAILELEEKLPAVSLTHAEIAILLASSDSRVRLFGIRLVLHTLR
jgi:hypothetical protein